VFAPSAPFEAPEPAAPVAVAAPVAAVAAPAAPAPVPPKNESPLRTGSASPVAVVQQAESPTGATSTARSPPMTVSEAAELLAVGFDGVGVFSSLPT
jgi:hypothetical protein